MKPRAFWAHHNGMNKIVAVRVEDHPQWWDGPQAQMEVVQGSAWVKPGRILPLPYFRVNVDVKRVGYLEGHFRQAEPLFVSMLDMEFANVEEKELAKQGEWDDGRGRPRRRSMGNLMFHPIPEPPPAPAPHPQPGYADVAHPVAPIAPGEHYNAVPVNVRLHQYQWLPVGNHQEYAQGADGVALNAIAHPQGGGAGQPGNPPQAQEARQALAAYFNWAAQYRPPQGRNEPEDNAG